MFSRELGTELTRMRLARISFEATHKPKMDEALERLKNAIQASESFVSQFATVKAAIPPLNTTVFAA